MTEFLTKLWGASPLWFKLFFDKYQIINYFYIFSQQITSRKFPQIFFHKNSKILLASLKNFHLCDNLTPDLIDRFRNEDFSVSKTYLSHQNLS